MILEAYGGIIAVVIAGVSLYLYLTGKIYTKQYVDELKQRYETETRELKAALALERQRNELVGNPAAEILRELAKQIHREITP